MKTITSFSLKFKIIIKNKNEINSKSSYSKLVASISINNHQIL
ncbi:hypothetical protein [Spiroplasma endosymbiont of Polydrusus pterygomalis]